MKLIDGLSWRGAVFTQRAVGCRGFWYNNVRQSDIVKAAGTDKSVTRRTFLNESMMAPFI